MTQQLNDIRKLWTELYDGNYQRDLETFLSDLETFKQAHPLSPLPAEWYRDVVVYSLYVDLFNESFEGLTEKLDYLQTLGVSCLWLLPILDSAMQDAGFDIRNFDKVRSDLVKSKDKTPEAVFEDFVKEAHGRGISVIFDIALNHISVEHPWFQAAKDDKTSPYRGYVIWSNTREKYKEARIIFKGMMGSNWTPYGDEYYFHRFFDIQPDLNYRNPTVLREMTMMLMRWLVKGVDGFRADAIPYLWKEEGTNCENLPKTHTIIKIFRAAMDYLRPGGILLAEANQPPREVANYFGNGDECLAAYHFPLMPRMYKALVLADGTAIKDALEPSFTPPIPENCQWFTFLRCHDELTLEMVTPEERKLLYNHYCRDPQWDFREGEGISARLADLMNNDARKINLLNAILLTLVGTPVIFYGDEIAKTNDKAFYDEVFAKSGYPDSRYLNRGRMDWAKAERDLKNPDSIASQVFYPLQRMMQTRKQNQVFSRGALTFLDVGTDAVLAYQRRLESQTITVLANLSGQEVRLENTLSKKQERDLLEQAVTYQDDKLVLVPYGFYWFAA